MRPLVPIAAATILASCTQPQEPPGAAVSREIAGKVAGPAQACISSFPGQNLRVVDASTIAYGYGRTVYVNHLGAPCPALEQHNTIIVDARDGSQYCRGNRVRGLEAGAVIPGPWCTLGEWVPYRMP
jgi:hypothetical protein